MGVVRFPDQPRLPKIVTNYVELPCMVALSVSSIQKLWKAPLSYGNKFCLESKLAFSSSCRCTTISGPVITWTLFPRGSRSSLKRKTDEIIFADTHSSRAKKAAGADSSYSSWTKKRKSTVIQAANWSSKCRTFRITNINRIHLKRAPHLRAEKNEPLPVLP